MNRSSNAILRLSFCLAGIMLNFKIDWIFALSVISDSNVQRKVHQSFHDHPPLEANSKCEDVWTNFIVHLQTSVDQLQKYVIDQRCVLRIQFLFLARLTKWSSPRDPRKVRIMAIFVQIHIPSKGPIIWQRQSFSFFILLFDKYIYCISPLTLHREPVSHLKKKTNLKIGWIASPIYHCMYWPPGRKCKEEKGELQRYFELVT